MHLCRKAPENQTLMLQKSANINILQQTRLMQSRQQTALLLQMVSSTEPQCTSGPKQVRGPPADGLTDRQPILPFRCLDRFFTICLSRPQKFFYREQYLRPKSLRSLVSDAEIFCNRFAHLLKSIFPKFSFRGSEYHYEHNKNFRTEILYPG